MEKVHARKRTKSFVQCSECGKWRPWWFAGMVGEGRGERDCRGVDSEWVKEDFETRGWSSTPSSSSLDGIVTRVPGSLNVGMVYQAVSQ